MATRILFGLLMVLVPSSFAVVHTWADEPGRAEKLGTVHFATSCGTTTESQFNRAVALMHSFQFAQAIEAFHAIAASDPSCSMAYWGIALSSWGNPFASDVKPAAQLDQGAAKP